MTSVECFSAQLSSKLTVDLAGLRKQIELGKEVMASTESEMAVLGKSVTVSDEASAASIRSLERERDAVNAVRRLVTDFETTSANLSLDVKHSTERSSQDDQNTRRMRERIEKELRDAQARVASAQQGKKVLDGEVAALVAEIEPAEQAAKAELSRLAGEACSAKLKAQLAFRTADLYKAEAEKLQEEPAVKLHAAKSARAYETMTLVSDLKAQLKADEEKIDSLSKAQQAVEQAEVEAQARARQHARMYEAQLDAARGLAAKQGTFLQEKLVEAQNKENVGEAEATLLGVTIDFVKGQHAASLEEIASLEASMAEEAKAAASATLQRQVELRQLRAEYKAVTIACEHRRKYVEDKSAQLTGEEREVAEATTALEGRPFSIEMVRAELESARKVCDKLEGSAEAAEKARREMSAKVDQLRDANRSRLGEKQSQLESEASVLAEQQRYVASLEARLRDESCQCIDGAAATATRARGETIVLQNAAAARTFMTELKQRLEKCEAALVEAKRQQEAATKQSDAEAQRLAEQKASMADALAKLNEYEANLVTNLDALKADGTETAALPTGAAVKATAQAAAPRSDIVEVRTPAGASSGAAMEAQLKKLHSSAQEAIEAARVIEKASKGGTPAAAAPAATKGAAQSPSVVASAGKGRPASPDDVSTRIEVEAA